MYNTFVKPYKEKVDFIEEQIDGVQDFVNDKWNIISKYNIFGN